MSRLLTNVFLLVAMAALLVVGSASARSFMAPCGELGGEPCPVDAPMPAPAHESIAANPAAQPPASVVTLSAKVNAADLKVGKAKATGTLRLSAALGHALRRTVTIKGSTRCYVGSATAPCASLYAKTKVAANFKVDTPASASSTIVASAITLAG